MELGFADWNTVAVHTIDAATFQGLRVAGVIEYRSFKPEVLNVFQINLIESTRRRKFAVNDWDKSRHVLCFSIGFEVTAVIIVGIIVDLLAFLTLLQSIFENLGRALLWVLRFLRIFLRELP